MKVFYIFVIFVCLSIIPPVYADELQPLVLNDSNIVKFEETVKKAGNVNFIVLQSKPELLNGKMASSLMSWVERGGTLWFYDSRLASFLGFKNSPMVIKDLESRTMNAEFGAGKMSGVALGAEAQRGPTITLGVRRIVAFVPEVGKNSYSAVAAQPDLVPLLKVPQQTSLVGALLKRGKGVIIFKPLLWEKQYDGGVFQRRIINYSQVTKPVPVLEN